MHPYTSPAHTSSTPKNKLLGVVAKIRDTLVNLSPQLFIVRYNLLSKLSWLHKKSMLHKFAMLALFLSVYLLFNWYVNRTVDTVDKSHASVLNKAIRIMPRCHTASQDSPIEIAARWVRIGAYGLAHLTRLGMMNRQDKLTQLMGSHWVVAAGISIGLVIFIDSLVSDLKGKVLANTLPLRQNITNAAEFIVSKTFTGASSNSFFESHRLVAPPSSNP